MVLRKGVLIGVGLEAAALAAAVAWMVWQVVTGASAAPGPALALALFAVLLALGLLAAARAVMRHGSGPARAVVVTWQLVQAGSAGTIIGAGGTLPAALAGAWLAAGLAVVVVALTVLDARRSQPDPDPDVRSADPDPDARSADHDRP